MAKLDEVTELMSTLTADLKDNNLSQNQRRELLGKLKVHGREVNGSDPIFSKDGIKTLSLVGLNDVDEETSKEALRCIANAMLLKAETREYFIEQGFVEVACMKYESDSEDFEFLLGRILFWTVYAGSKEQVQSWTSDNSLSKNISKAILRNSKLFSKSSTQKPNQMMEMALGETLKLMFNVQFKLDDQEDLFMEDIAPLFKMLCRMTLPKPPLQPPLTHIINSLSNIKLDLATDTVFPNFDSKANAARLVDILDKSTTKELTSGNSAFEFDEQGGALLKVLYEMYPCAPDDVKSYLREHLLPSEQDRDLPLGQGTSLPSRLLQLSTSPMNPKLRHLISGLQFRLSDEDATKFVRNVGFGYASGYLVSEGIPIPQEFISSEGGAGQSSEGVPVNPITGQALDMEAAPDMSDMTEEEKEREAEKLFVLFERLNKTGVVSVQNPVRQAVEEGRFEELED